VYRRKNCLIEWTKYYILVPNRSAGHCISDIRDNVQSYAITRSIQSPRCGKLLKLLICSTSFQWVIFSDNPEEILKRRFAVRVNRNW
jgi:hypothetical protein